MYIGPYATKAPREMWLLACRLVPSYTIFSIIMPMRKNWIHCFQDPPENQKMNNAVENNPPRIKKSVVLSGVVAGNTAICSVGRTGNDLHYRGYDILDIADSCEFEEIAYLLVHGKLPTRGELDDYKAKLKSMRGLPAALKTALEALPPSTHPMDVMRTGVSVLGCLLPEKEDQNPAGAREIADRLMASLGS